MGIWLWNNPVVWTSIPLGTTVSGKKVVIDPGHGGFDPGAKSKTGLTEKDINLDVALRLKRYLSRAGIYCYLIRESDQDFSNVFPHLPTKKKRDLAYRTHLTNRWKADILISIHANSFPQSIYHGAQTFYKAGDKESKKLAETIQEALIKQLGPNHRQAKIGDYRMLNDVNIPGVTVEMGFLSNPEESKMLANPLYREKIAGAIFRGIVNYFINQ